MRNKPNVVALFLFVLLIGGCKNSKEMMSSQEKGTEKPAISAGPPAIVYKTKQDYTDKVAVILSQDGQQIVAYPHPQDIARRGAKVQPTILAEGYLLDNQGINQWVAFTRYTFAEYAALAEAPGMEELMASILDRDPLLEICYCGNRTKYPELAKSMNELIAKKLNSCEPLKKER